MLEVNEDKKNIIESNNVSEVVDNDVVENNVSMELPSDSKAAETSNLVNSNVVDTTVPEPNCLALTVRKDYNLIIVKNIFTTTGRLSWKIVLSTIVLNFLRMIF